MTLQSRKEGQEAAEMAAFWRKAKQYGGLLLLSTFTAMLVLWIFSRGHAPESTAPTGAPPPDLSQRPFGIARQLLDDLRGKRYQEAQGLFSVGLGRAWDVPTMRARFSSVANLDQLTVQRETVRGDAGTVQIGVQGARPTWTLTFKMEAGKWRISKLQGISP